MASATAQAVRPNGGRSLRLYYKPATKPGEPDNGEARGYALSDLSTARQGSCVLLNPGGYS